MQNVFIFMIGYLQMVNSLCVELEKMPLITFWSPFLVQSLAYVGAAD
jgi:hypothetical protein